jgi:UDP-N-acetylenolpyruvoylglucosamine reductase
MIRLTAQEVNAILHRGEPMVTVYLVGIAGCGMSGLAHLLLDLGHQVVGSDLVETPEIHSLRARGAKVFLGHTAAQLHEARPTLVVYSSAIPKDNVELEAALQAQRPIARRAVALAALFHRQRGICVAGMHGKTTTAGMLAFALEQMKLQPSYAIGAPVPQLGRPARFGGADQLPVESALSATHRPATAASGYEVRPERWFVAEADESDGTLREFHPEHAIVLNVDEEHLDYFANFEAICGEFKEFGGQTRGRLVFCADDPQLVTLFARGPGAISVGFNPLAMYRIESKAPAAARGRSASALTCFELWHEGAPAGQFTLHLAGEKNVSNAACVIALLLELGCAPTDIAAALGAFKGALRRQQEVFSDENFRVFDDYGHHPREVQATLRALKSPTTGRLLVAFQPHRFTRTRHLMRQFASSFGMADRLWLTEIYSAGEPEIPGVDGLALADAVRSTGQSVEFVPAVGDLPGLIRNTMQPGDVVVFLGAGDITKAAHLLARRLRDEMPPSQKQILADLAARLAPTTLVKANEPLARKTTLRVGGKADFYVEPAGEAELAEVLKFCRERGLPFMLLGRGSNLLIRDGGIRGVVVSLAHESFSEVHVQGERMRCGAGARLKTVANEACKHGIAGLEFLETIPGSIGGALRMNAGCMGAWTFGVVESVRFMDYEGQIHIKPVRDIEVAYRSCPTFQTAIALGAVLKGRMDSREAIKKRMAQCRQRRWTTQPHNPSAGCIFKNPKAIPAGRLIDELGLKGRRVGGAIVSDVHANFIVTEPGAKAWDVLQLIQVLKQRAHEARGVELETEVEIVGEDA